MSLPRVLYIVDGFGQGGTELSAIRLSDDMRNVGHVCAVVCIGHEGLLSEEYRKRDVPVHFERVGPFGSLRLLPQLRRLRALIGEIAPDIVHAHDIYSDIAMGLLIALYGPCTFRTVMSHRWGMPAAASWRVASRLAYRQADAVVANGPGAALIAARVAGGNVPVLELPNPIDPGDFSRPFSDPRLHQILEAREQGKTLVLAFLGRLAAVKRVHLAIEVLALLRTRGVNVVLLVGGAGPEESSLRACASQLDMQDHVLFLGPIDRIPSLFSISDIALLTSENEGTPNTVLEAMASGCAVVATSVGGVTALMHEAGAGVLVDDGEDLVARIADEIQGLSCSRDRLRMFGETGKRYIEQHHSRAAFEKALRDAYDRP